MEISWDNWATVNEISTIWPGKVWNNEKLNVDMKEINGNNKLEDIWKSIGYSELWVQCRKLKL